MRLSFARLSSRLRDCADWARLGCAAFRGLLAHTVLDFNWHIRVNAVWAGTSAAMATPAALTTETTTGCVSRADRRNRSPQSDPTETQIDEPLFADAAAVLAAGPEVAPAPAARNESPMLNPLIVSEVP